MTQYLERLSAPAGLGWRQAILDLDLGLAKNPPTLEGVTSLEVIGRVTLLLKAGLPLKGLDWHWETWAGQEERLEGTPW